mmetsp:Transcript_42162/g.120617  ORF Transcript_42162/g.120617 Transcript_42162/m.120617 type:complete len:87 (+) Transcript_42162:309-569(+)
MRRRWRGVTRHAASSASRPWRPASCAARWVCRHSFHSECVEKWWLHRVQSGPTLQLSCPICRHEQSVDADAKESSERRPLLASEPC